MESFAVFAKSKLNELQKELDIEIPKYLNKDFGLDAPEYHESAAYTIETYKDLITRPAKRLRGSFVIEAYKMFQPTLTPDVMKAAIAIEMVHAYLLAVDDFNDKSDLRRSLPTMHKLHQKYHTDRNFTGDSLHYGNSIAVYVGLLGMHHANILLSQLNLAPELLLRAIRIVNDTVNITIYGQIRDILNQQAPNIKEHDVMEVHRYKTARYTYFNPIQIGAALAGQTDATIAKFKTYTEKAGIAFQIQDDILGVFGKPEDTGKSNMDDIMEGKATLLTIYAFEHATPEQTKILKQAVGDRNLMPELFEQVQQVIRDTGSLEHSKQVAHELVKEASESMYTEFPDYVDNEGFQFITGIADYMIERKL